MITVYIQSSQGGAAIVDVIIPLYPYTLSYALRTGLPIVAPRLGAFSERLADYPQARLLDWDTPPEGCNDLLMTFWRGRDHDMAREDSGDDA